MALDMPPGGKGRPRNAISFPSHEKKGPPSGPGRLVSRFTSEPSAFME